MSHKSVPQQCPLRVSHKSVPQQCPTRVSYKSVPQELPTRVSHKSFLLECPTRVSRKSVPQELPTRVSHKSFLLECPTRVSRKSVPQEFPTRVSHKSVLQECHLDICSFSNVFAFGFVGSILFFPRLYGTTVSSRETKFEWLTKPTSHPTFQDKCLKDLKAYYLLLLLLLLAVSSSTTTRLSLFLVFWFEWVHDGRGDFVVSFPGSPGPCLRNVF